MGDVEKEAVGQRGSYQGYGCHLKSGIRIRNENETQEQILEEKNCDNFCNQLERQCYSEENW